MHGAGHIGGNPGTHEGSNLLDYSGEDMIGAVNQGRDITSAEENDGFANRLKKKEHFGDEDFVDNYNKNARSNNFQKSQPPVPFKIK